MKNTLNKNLLALLILATAGMTAGVHAASSTTVRITATVAEKLGVEPIDPVTFDTTTTKDVNIKVISNKTGSTSKAKVTVTADTGKYEGTNLLLQDQTAHNKLKMGVKLNTTDFADGKAEITDVVVGAPVKLHLTPVEDENQVAGQYTGELTVTVEKV